MINFGVWAPDEETFWASWRNRGIVDAQNNFMPGYSEIQITAGVWHGKVVNSLGETVLGWHCNARVFGSLEQQFIHGLNQTDENGNLLDIFDRTWAAEVFQLTEQPADPETGFPAGYRNATGITYTDALNFSSPSNVWA